MSEQPGGELILYPRGESLAIAVRLDGGTVWLTQAQMADLFQTTPQNITLHLGAIFAEGELSEAATCKDYLQVRKEGSRKVTRNLRHYRLEAILAVGYRVKSTRGTQFRRWASEILSEYTRKGFAMDDARLKSLGGGSYWKELLEWVYRLCICLEEFMFGMAGVFIADCVEETKRGTMLLRFFGG